jgi:hypothetical protein
MGIETIACRLETMTAMVWNCGPPSSAISSSGKLPNKYRMCDG